jgi:hypothetical protein
MECDDSSHFQVMDICSYPRFRFFLPAYFEEAIRMASDLVAVADPHGE